jgi:predicted DNA-binding WGR domain protein
MIRRFEYRDEKSDKFWEYEHHQDDSDQYATVTWGRIGSTGQCQVVDLATAEKRAREKLGKGYVEVAVTRKKLVKKPTATFPTPQEEHPPEDRHEDMWDELIRNIKAK